MTPESSQRRQLTTLGVLCGAGLIALYGFLPYTYSHLMHLTSVFGALWTMWHFYPDFEHGMLVPFLSAFVVYTRRRQLAALPINGWWPGIVAVVLSLALFWAGRRVDNQYIGFFSFQILLASLVLWLLGWRWLKALAFPLAFLVFTWPMPFLDNIVTFPLRMFMSNMSAAVINTFGVPVIQNGSGILSAPNPSLHLAAGQLFSVDVANPCSGIRSLFALLMVSALYANFTLDAPWKRAVLFLSSVPLAIAGNLFRILLLTLGIITLGAPTAIGTLEHPTWFHECAGFAVFLVALGGMLLICNALNSDPAELRKKWRSLSGVTAKTRPAPSERDNTPADIY
jgi:exosortase